MRQQRCKDEPQESTPRVSRSLDIQPLEVQTNCAALMLDILEALLSIHSAPPLQDGTASCGWQFCHLVVKGNALLIKLQQLAF